MKWQINYFSENVSKRIDSWPVGIRALQKELKIARQRLKEVCNENP